MILFHGSKQIVKTPEYGRGKKYNDYGQGFYCTQEKEMAAEWAVDLGVNGFINCYTIDTKGLEIVNLQSSEYCMLNWLAILLQNRTFSVNNPIARMAKDYIVDNFAVNVNNADIISGYRADDSYFSFAQDFINNSISYSQLCAAMHLGNLGKQIMIKSQKAFDKLQFSGFEVARADIWFPKKKHRDDAAREKYFASRFEVQLEREVFANQIISEKMGVKELLFLEKEMP